MDTNQKNENRPHGVAERVAAGATLTKKVDDLGKNVGNFRGQLAHKVSKSQLTNVMGVLGETPKTAFAGDYVAEAQRG